MTTTSCTGQDQAVDDRLQVVASFYPLQFVAERVGGDAVQVENLTPPRGHAHNLELTPAQVARVGEADLVLYQSHLQPATDEAVEQQRPAAVVDAAPRADLPGGDPHFWLDPIRLAGLAEEVADALGERDPARAQDFDARAEQLGSELSGVDRQYRAGLAACGGATLVTAHTAFGYLADRYELEQVGIAGLDPEVEPSPARLRSVSQVAREAGVRTVFFEVVASPDVAETLADDLGVGTAVLDPLESQADSGVDYLGVMRANLRALQSGLACPSATP
jgi:zinc transport system substrate-binding protein